MAEVNVPRNPMFGKPYTSLKTAKRDYIRMARQLCYSGRMIEKIQNATSENEIMRLMKEAREKKEYF